VLICLVIPHFDHLDQFRRVLPELVAQGYPLVIVDDASPASCFEALQQLLEEQAKDTVLVRHSVNQGKGGAVMTGLKAAREAGFTHAIQIDADGQHDINGFARLVDEAKRHPEAIICGEPVFDESISKLRYYSRFLTLFLVWLETLSTEIRDALCGFRLYPLDQAMILLQKEFPGKRMAFDPEILVRAVWSDIQLRYIPVKIAYPEDGKSHFHYFGDNVEITWMHIRLVFGMLPRIPFLLRRKRALAGRAASK
jgi:glycosyltransferase involved in cell wall biosynthesis